MLLPYFDDGRPSVADDIESIEIWGDIEPITVPVPWNNEMRPVKYHLLTTQEERELKKAVEAEKHESAEDAAFRESQYRLAIAIREVNNKAIEMTWEQRIAWIDKWPAVLMDAVLLGYQNASFVPFVVFDEMSADPNTEAAPGSNGQPSAGAAYSAARS